MLLQQPCMYTTTHIRSITVVLNSIEACAWVLDFFTAWCKSSSLVVVKVLPWLKKTPPTRIWGKQLHAQSDARRQFPRSALAHTQNGGERLLMPPCCVLYKNTLGKALLKWSNVDQQKHSTQLNCILYVKVRISRIMYMASNVLQTCKSARGA